MTADSELDEILNTLEREGKHAERGVILALVRAGDVIAQAIGEQTERLTASPSGWQHKGG